MIASNDRRSVLLLSTLYPPEIGGAETYAETLTERMRAAGTDVLVVTDESQGEASRPSHVVGLSTYRERIENKDLAPLEQLYFGVLPEIESALSSWHKPDVVFANSLDMAIVGRVIASSLGRPLIVNFHEHQPEAEAFGPGRLALGYRFLAPDAIVAGSLFYYERAIRYGAPRSLVHLIHHGVPVERFEKAALDRERIRRALGVDAGDILVLTAGRFKERKNQRMVLEALSHATTVCRSRMVLLLAGSTSSASSEYLDALKDDVERLGLSRDVIISTEITPSVMPSYTAAADIAAVPSREEGLGLAVLEAMAAGVPVLTSAAPGIVEIVDGTRSAAVVPDLQPATWACWLLRLAHDPKLRTRIGRLGKRHVERHFSADRMYEQTAAVIQKAALQ